MHSNTDDKDAVPEENNEEGVLEMDLLYYLDSMVCAVCTIPLSLPGMLSHCVSIGPAIPLCTAA